MEAEKSQLWTRWLKLQAGRSWLWWSIKRKRPRVVEDAQEGVGHDSAGKSGWGWGWHRDTVTTVWAVWASVLLQELNREDP